MTGIYYSLDGGDTWIYTANEANQEVTVTTPLVHKGEYVLWKGVNKRCANGVIHLSNSSRFSSDGKFAVAGDLQSLIWGDEYETQKSTKDWFSFTLLFSGSKVKNAKNLRFEATSLFPGTYYEMFSGCTILKVPPVKLQYDTANTGDRGIYQGIFKNCTSLTYSPDILIPALSKNSFKEAFYGCPSLQHICIMSTDISASNCLQSWVQNVSLTGIFNKLPETTFSIGNNGIPTGWTVIDTIMTSTSNPELMAICYAQGWAAHSDYMTLKEAQGVTSVGTVFRSSSIGDFHEFQYFTSVTSLVGQAFRESTITGITFPDSIVSIGQYAFLRCAGLTSIKLNEGVRTVDNQWIWGARNMKLIDFPSTMVTMNGLGFQTNETYYKCICRATTPPSLGSSSYTNALLAFYVPDDSVDLYKAASKWADFATKIKPLSEYIPS